MLRNDMISIACVKATASDVKDQEALALRAIFDIRVTISQGDFGKAHGLGTASMVWQYLTGHRPLNLAAAIKFAAGMEVQIDAFSPRLAAEVAAAYPLTSAAHHKPSQRAVRLVAAEPAAPRPLTTDELLLQLGTLLSKVPEGQRKAASRALEGWALEGGADHWRTMFATLLESSKQRHA